VLRCGMLLALKVESKPELVDYRRSKSRAGSDLCRNRRD
jgi:hypothetical protein